jgi:DNA-directed RNA polymerase specialized sigma24 family protein
LSDDHRRVVVLRNLELKSFAEIAAVMQRTPDAVRKLWYRAIEVLADRLEASDVVR